MLTSIVKSIFIFYFGGKLNEAQSIFNNFIIVTTMYILWCIYIWFCKLKYFIFILWNKEIVLLMSQKLKRNWHQLQLQEAIKWNICHLFFIICIAKVLLILKSSGINMSFTFGAVKQKALLLIRLLHSNVIWY